VTADPELLSRPETARMQLELRSFAGFAVDLSSRNPLPGLAAVDTSIIGGGLSLRGEFFVRPLVDDDSPLLLQPFLQRASTFSLQAGGSGSRTAYSQYGRSVLQF
jgi:hypothetical protein